MISPQLEELATVASSCGLRTWADTGTALGLARQGGSIHAPGADDIDFSVWEDDLDVLELVARELEQLGYSQERWYWRGLLFKRKFFRPGDAQSYPVDFKIYRPFGEECWTPLVYHRRVRTKPLWTVAKRLRERAEQTSRDRHLGRWPLGAWVGVHTFVVPAHHFLDLEPWGDTEILMPTDIDAFLSLHYGDWQKPISPWNSAADDGAVRRGHPLRVVGPSVFQVPRPGDS